MERSHTVELTALIIAAVFIGGVFAVLLVRFVQDHR